MFTIRTVEKLFWHHLNPRNKITNKAHSEEQADCLLTCRFKKCWFSALTPHWLLVPKMTRPCFWHDAILKLNFFCLFCRLSCDLSHWLRSWWSPPRQWPTRSCEPKVSSSLCRRNLFGLSWCNSRQKTWRFQRQVLHLTVIRLRMLSWVREQMTITTKSESKIILPSSTHLLGAGQWVCQLLTFRPPLRIVSHGTPLLGAGQWVCQWLTFRPPLRIVSHGTPLLVVGL